jgi:hypothetical protein
MEGTNPPLSPSLCFLSEARCHDTRSLVERPSAQARGGASVSWVLWPQGAPIGQSPGHMATSRLEPQERP